MTNMSTVIVPINQVASASGLMAHSSGSPDAPTRSLPSWAAADHSESFEEALKALETYKKKDPSKGRSFIAECLLMTEFE